MYVAICSCLFTKKTPRRDGAGRFELMPGGVLLSRGEAPHYHRRKAFSLLSSGWIQVVPARYGHQANWSELARPGSAVPIRMAAHSFE